MRSLPRQEERFAVIDFVSVKTRSFSQRFSFMESFAFYNALKNMLASKTPGCGPWQWCLYALKIVVNIDIYEKKCTCNTQFVASLIFGVFFHNYTGSCV